ncbi:MAG: hypothetical protein O3A55_06980 [Bacteroidetes bacterium]|nr:hypothetical protein [Bacteroidota bacterium]
MVYKLFLILFFILQSCSPPITKICNTKISPQLVDEINTSNETIFEIVIYLNDSTDLKNDFPFLDDVSSLVATGRLNKKQISLLCNSNKIKYIDLSKRRYPTLN